MKKKIVVTVFSVLLATTMMPLSAFAESDLNNEKKAATEITKQINENVYQLLDFDDKQEEEFATKGFITAPETLTIKDDNDNTIFDQSVYDFVKDTDAPDSANPSLWRNTQLNTNYGLFQVTDDIYQVRGYDISNMTFVRSDNGWIILDCLASETTAKAALDLFKSEMGDVHISAVIISHAHVDHYGGIQGILTAEELADSTLSLEDQIASGKTAIIVPEGFQEAVMSENVLLELQ